MKYLVVYSSRTGNTKKIAQAIFEILPDEKDIFPVEKAPDASGYDFVAVDFWVDKGLPDKKSFGIYEKGIFKGKAAQKSGFRRRIVGKSITLVFWFFLAGLKKLYCQ